MWREQKACMTLPKPTADADINGCALQVGQQVLATARYQTWCARNLMLLERCGSPQLHPLLACVGVHVAQHSIDAGCLKLVLTAVACTHDIGHVAPRSTQG